MIAIERLSYIVLATRDLDAEIGFFTDILGLELAGTEGGRAYLRSDMRGYSLLLDATGADDVVGLELRDSAQLDKIETLAASASLACGRGDEAACRARRVKELVWLVDNSGNRLEFVWRPLTMGWRFHGSRDHGLSGLQAVAMRSTSVADDVALWADLGARISDWVGDATYLRIDDAHHRIALHPSDGAGVLHTVLEVEGIDNVMRAGYFLRDRQIPVVHGPGQEPTSGRISLTFRSPDNHLVTLATGMHAIRPDRLPRQFPDERGSYCAWGSETSIAELGGERRKEPAHD